MKILANALGLLIGSRGTEPEVSEENWTVAGAGNLIGREWTSHAQANGVERVADVGWLEGFFSGVSLGENFAFLKTPGDLTKSIAWMDHRLANNPQERVSQAAAQLAAQLLDPRRADPW